MPVRRRFVGEDGDMTWRGREPLKLQSDVAFGAFARIAGERFGVRPGEGFADRPAPAGVVDMDEPPRLREADRRGEMRLREATLDDFTRKRGVAENADIAAKPEQALKSILKRRIRRQRRCGRVSAGNAASP